MLKKLDWYIVKTFLGPFLFIFSVLFFIFIVQFAWQEMGKLVGKGLDWLTITELLFWLGINVIQLVLPLTILLGSIMTFGGFGERYELAAMKASGIPLTRILTSLFVLVSLMSVGLYFFGERVMPYSQRKARTIMYTIIQTKPTMQIKEGVFIESIPGYQLKINKVSGVNSEKLEDVFVHQASSFGESTMTILAKNGNLAPDKKDNRFLKMELYDGIAYSDNIEGKNIDERMNQENQTVKFDTLNYYIDISSLIEKSPDEQDIGSHYKFLNGKDLKSLIDSLGNSHNEFYQSIQENNFNQAFYYKSSLKKIDSLNTNVNPTITWDEFNTESKDKIITQATQLIQRDEENLNFYEPEIISRENLLSKITLHYYRNLSYAVTCIAFFLIGAPLGAIVKKGGIGMPVIISIIIFVVYYIINFASDNMAKNGQISPFVAAWLANSIALPLALILTYKANKDSSLFTIGNYLDPVIKFFNRFKKTNHSTEHSRYQ